MHTEVEDMSTTADVKLLFDLSTALAQHSGRLMSSNESRSPDYGVFYAASVLSVDPAVWKRLGKRAMKNANVTQVAFEGAPSNGWLYGGVWFYTGATAPPSLVYRDGFVDIAATLGRAQPKAAPPPTCCGAAPLGARRGWCLKTLTPPPRPPAHRPATAPFPPPGRASRRNPRRRKGSRAANTSARRRWTTDP